MTAFQNRVASTAACLTTVPAHATEVPRELFPGAAALHLGAHGCLLMNLVGPRIGDTHLKTDVNGGALGIAILPGDRWRRSHDAIKHKIYLDGRSLGIDLQKEATHPLPQRRKPRGVRKA